MLNVSRSIAPPEGVTDVILRVQTTTMSNRFREDDGTSRSRAHLTRRSGRTGSRQAGRCAQAAGPPPSAVAVLNDAGEVVGDERRPADERAVDVGLAHQLGGVGRLH